jgi:hypothetical protein
MGYLRELFAIRACNDKCTQAWKPHLQQTQAVLRAAVERCPCRRKAVILGSGWLLDVPLEELAGAFAEVVLVDLVHPLATRRRAWRHANVRLLQADVTDTVEAVYRCARRRGTPLPRSQPRLFRDDPEIDLIASVNILSQLSYLPERYLLMAGVHSPEAVAAYARPVVEAHLEYLRSLPGVVALVADVECLLVNRAGEVVESSSTVQGVPLPCPGREWIWKLAPVLYLSPHQGQHRRVVGIVDVKNS